MWQWHIFFILRLKLSKFQNRYFKLGSGKNLPFSIDKIFGFNSLLLFCFHRTDLAKPFHKIVPIIFFKSLLLEIRPIELRLWFGVNGDEYPFEYLISRRFSVIDFYLFQFFYFDRLCNFNSFLAGLNIFPVELVYFPTELFFNIFLLHVTSILIYLPIKLPMFQLQLSKWLVTV